MKIYTVGAQAFDSPHDPIVSSVTLTVFPMAVMQELRAIYADPHVDVFGADKLAPRIINRHGVGLNRMPKSGLRYGKISKQILVIGNRQRQGFAGVPNHAELSFHETALEDSLKNLVKDLRF
jgi:hypothetical protein